MARLDGGLEFARRIAITQRRVPASEIAGPRDALDAGWASWMAAELPTSLFMGMPNVARGDDAVRLAEGWGVDTLILAGGEDVGSSPDRDAVEAALLAAARARGWPVIGICRGMQQLHRASGGELVELVDHVGRDHPVLTDDGTRTVNSWHRWGVREVAAAWRVLATAGDGSIEAMRHRELPWLGVMWHPERSPGGADAARSWIHELLWCDGKALA